MKPKRWTKIVFGPELRGSSRAATGRSRGCIAVMPTIEVMPMTTPSTVSAERILLPRTRVDRHDDDFAEQTETDRHGDGHLAVYS